MVKTLPQAEFYRHNHGGSRTGRAMVFPCADGAWAAGLHPHIRQAYRGTSLWLSVAGVGDARYNAARNEHVASGRPVACWDMGYLGKSKDLINCYVRVSINTDHPTHAMMDMTPSDPSRWLALRDSKMFNDVYVPDGPVVVLGMGPKFHSYLGEHDWETKALHAAAARFPRRKIIYRPKPNSKAPPGRPIDAVVWPHISLDSTLRKVLKGASLMICRHSNAAVEACILGVPVECEGGAAHWLYHRGANPTEAERMDFLHRVCWWQWRFREMGPAWQFLVAMEAKLRVAGAL